MSIFSFLSSIAFSFYLFIAIYAIVINKESRINRSFAYISLSFSIWALGQAFSYSELDINKIWFWYRFSSIGWCLFPSLTLNFILNLSNKENILKKKWVLFLLIIIPCIFIARSFFGVLLANSFEKNGLGNIEVHAIHSPWYWAYVIYCFLTLVIGLAINYRWKKSAKFKIERKKADLTFIIILTALIIGSITNIIFPYYHVMAVPAIAPIVVMFCFGIIWVLNSKYRSILLKPVIEINEIINNIMDLVILAEPDGRISKVNKSVFNKLGYSETKLIGKNILELVSEKNDFLDEITKFTNNYITRMIWEINLIGSNGKKIPFSIIISSIKNEMDDIVGLLYICQDLRLIKKMENEIIDRKTAETALASLNESLEAKVIERTKELEIFATIDTMTGAYNRRVGLVLLEKEMHKAKRSKCPLTVCYVDIDNLKYINDLYGHKEGDYLIITTIRLIKESMRQSDILFRMGGDEFMVILSQCSLEDSLNVWKGIMSRIDNFNKNLNKSYQLNISYGFTEYDLKNPQTLDELIAKADKAMYEHKKRKMENKNQ